MHYRIKCTLQQLMHGVLHSIVCMIDGQYLKYTCSILFSILKPIKLNFHLSDESNTIHLKIVPSTKDPPPVLEHHVPMFLADKYSYNYSQWDLTTQQVGEGNINCLFKSMVVKRLGWWLHDLTVVGLNPINTSLLQLSKLIYSHLLHSTQV